MGLGILSIMKLSFWKWFAIVTLIASFGLFIFLFRYDVKIYKNSNPVIYDRLTGKISRAHRESINVHSYPEKKSLVVPNLFDETN